MKITPSNANVPIGVSKRSPSINRKTVIAIGLVIVMCFMWIRLLTSGESDPEKTADVSISPVPVSVSGQSDSGYSRIELPVIAGRNDEITHEMFTKESWKGIESGKKVTVNTNESVELDMKLQEARIRELAGSLRLGAIIDGGGVKGYEAFVDGELVSVGSILSVRQEGQTYVFTVVNVLKDRVILKWNEFTIAIKMF